MSPEVGSVWEGVDVLPVLKMTTSRGAQGLDSALMGLLVEDPRGTPTQAELEEMLSS